MKMLISKSSQTMTSVSWKRTVTCPPIRLIPLVTSFLILTFLQPTTESSVAIPPRFISLKNLPRKIPTSNETSTSFPAALSPIASSASSSSSSSSLSSSSSSFRSSHTSPNRSPISPPSSSSTSLSSSPSSNSSSSSSSSSSTPNRQPSSFPPKRPASTSRKAPSTTNTSSSSSPPSSSSNKSKPKFGNHRSKPDALARLSKVFGISRIPHRVFHRSPPQYMQDLYASITDAGGLSKASGPYHSNIIRSLPDRDPLHRMHFHYNLSEMDSHENVLQAQFHLYKMRPRPAGEGKPSHLVVIKVYQVLVIGDFTLRQNLRLLDVKRVPAHAHGWLIFNVTNAVHAWKTGRANNFGFLVTAQTHSGQPINTTYVRFAQRNEHHDSKQPILVMFGTDGRSNHPNYIKPTDKEYQQIKEDILKRERRKDLQKKSGFRQAVRMLNERERKRRPTHSGRSKRSAKRNGNRRKRTFDMYRYRHKRRSCARYEMFVDFEEIGWSGWIISPNSYNAYHCSGDCPFPLGQSQRPTNHATVQSIVHALRVGKDVGTPCCVPNKLYSINLLYFDDTENVILKQYDDMIVASCGCH